MDLDWIIQNWDTFLLGLTGVVTGASVLAKLTPTKVDDRYLAKLLKLIDFLALNTKPTTKRKVQIDSKNRNDNK